MAWEIVIPQTEEPKKIENFLKKRFPIGYVRKLFRKKAVRLNGRRPGPGELARPGDRVRLFISFEKEPGVREKRSRSAAGFEVLFEDQDLLVINKRAGLAVHEGKGVLKRHSLLGMLEELYSPNGIVPRLVHRIDRETSGLLLVAKSDEAAENLARRFEESGVDKEYLALVVGRLQKKQGAMAFPLQGREGQPVPALTLYRVEKELPGTTLVRVKIKTGRMHQIRLHFARSGHPVVMDDEHGDFAFNKPFRKAYGLKRQFLHACGLAFEYKGRRRKWTAALPEELIRTLNSLESGRGGLL